MGLHNKTSLLLLLGVCILLQTKVVDGACCTLGQPLYDGNKFWTGVNSKGRPVTPTVLTCSDGPCSGNNFDYFGTRDTVQSSDPDSCCDINLNELGEQASGAYYNPQQGTSGTWAPDISAEFNGGTARSGTGRTCDERKNRTICSLGRTDITYCINSVYKFDANACGAGKVYDNTKNNSVASEQACCRDKTCGNDFDPSACAPGFEYDDTQADVKLPSPDTCCMPKTCAALLTGESPCGADKRPKASAANQRPDNADPEVVKGFCCEPYTCSTLGPCQGPYLVDKQGVAGTITSPSTFEADCCEKESCRQLLELVSPPGPQCSANTKPKNTGMDTVRPGNSVAFQELCCEDKTCGNDFDPSACAPGFEYDDTQADVKLPSPDTCCRKLTCAKGYSSTIFKCSSGRVYKQDDLTMQTETFDDQEDFDLKCCKQLSPPTCNNRLGGNNDEPERYPCEGADPTGGWVYNTENDEQLTRLVNGTDVNPDNTKACCLRVTCLDVDPNKPGNQLWINVNNNVCCKGYTLNRNQTALANISPPNDVSCCLPQYCGDMDPNQPGNQSFRCPATGGWALVPEYFGRENPSQDTCCARQTCGDMTPETPNTPDPAKCCEGTVFNIRKNTTAIGTKNPQDICCMYQTCRDMNPNVQKNLNSMVDAFPCRQYNRTYNTAANAVQFPDVEKCCLPFETCANTSRTCDAPSVLTTHNPDRTFVNFQTECCVAPPPCRNAPGLTCNAFGNFVLDEAKRDLPMTNSSRFVELCCRPLTCGDRADRLTCTGGATFIDSSIQINTTFQKDCCKAPPTCRQATESCPDNFIPINPNRSYLNYTQDCCRQLNCNTARNHNATRYSCGNLIYNGTASTFFTNFTAQCCRAQNCDELRHTPCGTGFEYNGTSAVLVTGSFRDSCCRPIPATCNNTAPTASPPATTFGCSTVNQPGVWVYDKSKDLNTPPDCCKQLTCGTANGTSDSFKCDAGFEYNGAETVAFSNFKKECCRPSNCEDLRGRGSVCGIGSEYNGTAAIVEVTDSTYQQKCCKGIAPTCNNTTPQKPGTKFDCSSVSPQNAWVYDETKDAEPSPDGYKCCKRLTCGTANGTSTTFTCLDGLVYQGPDSTTFSDFRANCCVAPAPTPTCLSLKQQSTKCNSGFEPDDSRNGDFSSTANYNKDCCKQTCKSLVDAGTTCNSAYSIYRTDKNSTNSSPSDFQKNCCRDAKCGELRSQSCPTGSSFDENKDRTYLSSSRLFASTCCKSTSSTCKSLADSKAASCDRSWSVSNGAWGTSATVANYQTTCCRAAKCSELRNVVSCQNGFTPISDNTVLSQSATYQATCCRSNQCKWLPPEGNKCPSFSPEELAASIALGPISRRNTRDVLLTNRFVQKPGCTSTDEISWVNIASCTQCVKVQGVNLGTKITPDDSDWSLKDVPCDTVLTIAAHDGQYKKYSDVEVGKDIAMPNACRIRKLGDIPTGSSNSKGGLSRASSRRSSSSRSSSTWFNRARVSSSSSSGGGCASADKGSCHWQYRVTCH